MNIYKKKINQNKTSGNIHSDEIMKLDPWKLGIRQGCYHFYSTIAQVHSRTVSQQKRHERFKVWKWKNKSKFLYEDNMLIYEEKFK